MSVRRPDILLMVLDTQRVDRFSCYGYRRETTPQLDAFAADSTLYRYAFSTAQWTMPSHASMFTGEYPTVHTTIQSRSVLPDSLPTLAERLSSGGYFTAAFCNNPLVGVVNNGLRRGFVSFLNYAGLLTSRPNQAGQGSGVIGRYRQFFKRILARLLGRIQDSFARSDLLLALSFTPLMAPIWQTALSFKGNTQKSLNDTARLLINRKGVDAEQPVFAFVNLMGTHAPYHPPSRFIERFAPHINRDQHARQYLRRFNNDVYGWLAPLNGPIAEAEKCTLDGIYDAEVARQDEQIGDFFVNLRASGALDNTLVMICADHGDHLGEKDLIGHSFGSYNELVHVPLIVRDPQGSLPRGSRRDDVVSTRRVFHTALTAAGLAEGEERAYSLVQNSGADPDQGVVFAEAWPPQNVVGMVQRRQPELLERHRLDAPMLSVISGGHKLIQVGKTRQELYSLHEDPGETLNLSDILPERVEELQDRLDLFVHSTVAAAPAVEREAEDDPRVRRRLYELGYLE
jgi:arylsulfatase A-like enzyme